MSEDDVIQWQDTLDLVLAGRGDDLRCPFCSDGVIAVTQAGRVTRLECPRCRRFIEGRFADE